MKESSKKLSKTEIPEGTTHVWGEMYYKNTDSKWLVYSITENKWVNTIHHNDFLLEKATLLPEQKLEPKSGEVYEAVRLFSFVEPNWFKCFYIGKNQEGDHVVEWLDDGVVAIREEMQFRRVNTQRDEFIEKCIDLTGNSISDSGIQLLRSLYDKGLHFDDDEMVTISMEFVV